MLWKCFIFVYLFTNGVRKFQGQFLCVLVCVCAYLGQCLSKYDSWFLDQLHQNHQRNWLKMCIPRFHHTKSADIYIYTMLHERIFSKPKFQRPRNPFKMTHLWQYSVIYGRWEVGLEVILNEGSKEEAFTLGWGVGWGFEQREENRFEQRKERIFQMWREQRPWGKLLLVLFRGWEIGISFVVRAGDRGEEHMNYWAFWQFSVPNLEWKTVTLSWASVIVTLFVLHRWYFEKEMMDVDAIYKGRYYNEDVDWFHGRDGGQAPLISLACWPESPLCLHSQRKWMNTFISLLWSHHLGLSKV